MIISSRIRRLKPSATLAMDTRAKELKAQGRPVVSLAVGEPDFPTPAHIRAAAKQAIDDGFTRYTPVPGIPELRDAIAGYFKRCYGVDAPREATMATNGGKQALYNLFQALLDPGDEVLIPGPYWVSYPDMVELAEGVPVVVPSAPENRFLVTVDDLEAKRTPKTKALILNSPSNPTGCCYTQAQLDAIMDWAVARNVFVVSDEIYDQLTFPPSTPATLSTAWARHPGHVAVVNGVAKSFAMTGWRVGYALAHPDLIKAMTKLQGQSTSNICSIAQKAALAALTGPYDEVAAMRQAFIRRRDLAMSIVSAWPGVECPLPDGAFYLFPRVDAYYKGGVKGSSDLCARILDQGDVALVPGAAFGDDRCFRISYAVADETLASALERVGRVLRG
jgi:aspartate aminotransferase